MNGRPRAPGRFPRLIKRMKKQAAGRTIDPSVPRLTSTWLAGFVVLAWVGLVFAAYFIIHKPFTPANLVAIGELLVTLLAWLGTLVLAHAIARFAVPVLDGFSDGERLALRLGLGLGLLSLALLLLGFLPVYQSGLAWSGLAAGVAFGLKGFLADLRRLRPKVPQGKARIALACFTAFALLIAGLRTLAPPTAWDSLVYHLTGPKLYMQAHRLHHDLDLPYLGFPQAGSMLFLWGLLIGGPQLSQLMHFTFALLTLPLLRSIADQLAPGRGGLAMALILSVPSAALLASWAYVEWIAMFGGIAAFMLLHRGGSQANSQVSDSSGEDGPRFASHRTKYLILAGFFAALSLNVKYTSVGIVAGLLIFAAWQFRSFRRTLALAGLIFGFIAPYLLKNLLLTGNPTYPFLFGGAFWDESRATWYSRPGTGLSIQELALAPWEATIWGVEGKFVEGHPPYGATIGPAMLALVPLGLFGLSWLGAEKRRVLIGILIVAGSAYIIWLAELGFSVLLVQTRLLFPALPFVVLLAIFGFEAIGRLGKIGQSVRFVVGGVLGFGLALSAVETALSFVAASPIRVLTGQQSEQDYLVGQLGEHALAMSSINQLPAGSQVRFLWEPRSYYCAAHVTCEPDALLDRWWHSRQIHSDLAGIFEEWRAAGVTHVLLFELGAQEIRAAGFDPLSVADWEALDRFAEDYLEPVTLPIRGYSLYRLTGSAASLADPSDVRLIAQSAAEVDR